MDDQLPSLSLNRLTFQEQPGLGGTAHARRVERKNKRVDGRLNITLPWRESERTRKLPRLACLSTAALAASGSPRPHSLIGCCEESAAGLLCEPRMKWPDRARGRASGARGPLIGYKPVVPGGLCVQGSETRVLVLVLRCSRSEVVFQLETVPQSADSWSVLFLAVRGGVCPSEGQESLRVPPTALSACACDPREKAYLYHWVENMYRGY